MSERRELGWGYEHLNLHLNLIVVCVCTEEMDKELCNASEISLLAYPHQFGIAVDSWCLETFVKLFRGGWLNQLNFNVLLKRRQSWHQRRPAVCVCVCVCVCVLWGWKACIN